MVIILSIFSIFIFGFKLTTNKEPKEVYNIYLDGNKIGRVKSKENFEEYINKQEEALKKKYGVSKIYTPKGVEIKKVIVYSIILIATGIIVYIVGNLLGNTLEKLCNIFSVPQFLVGILLGFITSIPELITFFESQKYNSKTSNEMLGVVEATNVDTAELFLKDLTKNVGIVLDKVNKFDDSQKEIMDKVVKIYMTEVFNSVFLNNIVKQKT